MLEEETWVEFTSDFISKVWYCTQSSLPERHSPLMYDGLTRLMRHNLCAHYSVMLYALPKQMEQVYFLAFLEFHKCFWPVLQAESWLLTQAWADTLEQGLYLSRSNQSLCSATRDICWLKGLYYFHLANQLMDITWNVHAGGEHLPLVWTISESHPSKGG